MHVHDLEEMLEAHFIFAPGATNKCPTMTGGCSCVSNHAFISCETKCEINWVDVWRRSRGQISALEPGIFDEISHTRRAELIMN